MIFKDKLTDPSFLSWLASKLNIRTSRFFIYVANWRDRNFKETGGTANSIDDELKQEIFENSINSTDRCNGRNLISISKSKYNELFHNIENKTVSVDVVVNKRGRTLYQANRMVLTCTVRDIQKMLFDKGHSVSLGKVVSLKPFFITYPTDKEVALCLCKLYLNVRLIMEPLMKEAKEDGDEVFKSATKFFMSSCDCDKGTNGYYKWKCVNLKCKDCKDSSSPDFKCRTSNEQVKVSQFQQRDTIQKI